jgi:predicted ester cyclase
LSQSAGLSRLPDFVSDEARYNGAAIGLSGHLKMLERDVSAIPDLVCNVDFLIADPPMVAARLLFDCTPQSELYGIAINGRRVAFAENVFYRFTGGKIESVWSVIDQARSGRSFSMERRIASLGT